MDPLNQAQQRAVDRLRRSRSAAQLIPFVAARVLDLADQWTSHADEAEESAAILRSSAPTSWRGKTADQSVERRHRIEQTLSADCDCMRALARAANRFHDEMVDAAGVAAQSFAVFKVTDIEWASMHATYHDALHRQVRQQAVFKHLNAVPPMTPHEQVAQREITAAELLTEGDRQAATATTTFRTSINRAIDERNALG